MKPSFFELPPPRAATLVEPGTAVADLLADVAARMAPEQRAAFLAKMAAMDRRRELTSAAVTLGRA